MTDARPLEIYRLLLERFGPQRWWPAETPFEVAIGAILTQNTAWTGVARAIGNLRAIDALRPQRLAELDLAELEQRIRPAGFFRQKAARLQDFATYLLARHGGDMARLCAGELPLARERLLARPGIGPETADAILLYAGGRPSFVIDAYTRRIFSRLGQISGSEPYADLRSFFMDRLPRDAALYNEYHALLVALAKRHCRKRSPACPDCPLLELCRFGRATASP